jgi:MFS family permease
LNNSYITLLKEHTNLIGFGFMLTFFSAFGQTFVIALYVPEIIRDFGLSNASFASVYAGATILSALCLTWAGRFIDLIDLRKYAWMVLGGMVLSLLIFSQANHIVWLVLGLWGMRLCGQGLMSHTAISTMARYFDHVRGKAISITTLGHPAGGAVFPLLIAFSISAFGWRYTLIGSAAVLALLLPPLVAWLLRKVNTDPAAFRPESDPQQAAADQAEKKVPSYQDIISKKIFWIIAPAAIALPLLNTAFFFYQIPLGESKGWSTEWVAGSFTAYAVAGAFFTIVAGQLIDRLSAARLFPFYLFPMLAAMLLVVFSDSPWITPAYLALIGITNGFGNPIKSALQAEAFGIEYIGAVRSLFTALMVVSTALGPALFGLLLDAGLSFEEVIAIAALYLVFTILWSFRIVSKIRMLRWYAKLKPEKAGQ